MPLIRKPENFSYEQIVIIRDFVLFILGFWARVGY